MAAKRDLYENQLNTISQLTPQDGYNQAQLDAAKAAVTQNRDSAVGDFVGVSITPAQTTTPNPATPAAQPSEPSESWEEPKTEPAAKQPYVSRSAPVRIQEKLGKDNAFSAKGLTEDELDRMAEEVFGRSKSGVESTNLTDSEKDALWERITADLEAEAAAKSAEETSPFAARYTPGNFETNKPGIIRAEQTHGKDNFWEQNLLKNVPKSSVYYDPLSATRPDENPKKHPLPEFMVDQDSENMPVVPKTGDDSSEHSLYDDAAKKYRPNLVADLELAIQTLQEYLTVIQDEYSSLSELFYGKDGRTALADLEAEIGRVETQIRTLRFDLHVYQNTKKDEAAKRILEKYYPEYVAAELAYY